MKCSNCDSFLKEEWEFCVRCGAINPEYVRKQSKKYVALKETDYSNIISDYVSNFSYSKKTFLIVNILLFFLPLFFILFLSDTIISVLVFVILYFYFFCLQKILIKAELPWWGMFVPVYSTYLFFKIAFDDDFYVRWFFVEFITLNSFALYIVGITLIIFIFYAIYSPPSVILKIMMEISFVMSNLISPILMFYLGKRFGQNGILTALFGFVMIPLIALSNKVQYEG